VLTSEELVAEIGELDAEVIVIQNFFDLAEIEEKLSDALA
jgi:PTS system ascorbate-specific IIB component